MKVRLLPILILVPALGFSQLQIGTSDLNKSVTIDFDNSVSGVNFGTYLGIGFKPSPIQGQLNSGAWAFSGMSSGNITFGGTSTANPPNRGTSNGGESAGGFYSYNTANNAAPANRCLGWRPNGSTGDFAPGTITLKVHNNSGDSIKVLRIAYDAKSYNSSGGRTGLDVAYSLDNSSFTAISGLSFASDASGTGPSTTWDSKNQAAVITGLKWGDGDYLYIRWTSTVLSGGSGGPDEVGIDNITFRAYNVDYVWDGSSWSPNQPKGFQTGSSALVLKGSGAALIDTSTTLGAMIVEAGGRLNVTAELSMADSAVFYADGSGYCQVIGPVYGTSRYQSYLRTAVGRWFNIAIPVDATWNDVKGVPIQVSGSSDSINLWKYDASTQGTYSYDGTFEAITSKNAQTELIGYQLYAGDGTNYGSGPFTLETEGTLLDGNQTISVTGDASGRYNFIPNPYPSTLNWDLAHAANSELAATIYMQDGTPDDPIGTVTYTTYTAGSPGSGTNGADADIAPGQSFFVAVDATTDGSVVFTNSQRNLTGNSILYKTASTPGLIKLKVEQASGKRIADETVIRFDANQSDNYELKKDGKKWMNAVYPNIYTEVSGNDLVFNGMSNSFATTKDMDLYFQGDLPGSYEINISYDGLPLEWTVILEDKFTGTFTNLRKSSYTFSHGTGDNEDRFVLHFNKMGAIGLDESQLSNVFAFVKNNDMVVNLGELKAADLMVTDISGKVMTTLTGQQTQATIDMSQWAKGVYLLSVKENGKQILNTKIINQ